MSIGNFGRRPGREAGGAPNWLRSVPWGVCLWLTGAVLWITRIPFLPRTSPWQLTLTPPASLVEVTGNLVLVFPLGFLLGASTQSSVDSRGRALLWIVVSVFCVFMEAGQVSVASRLVSPYDFVLNLAGGWIGLSTGGRLGGSDPGWNHRTRRVLLALLVAGYAGVVGWMTVRIPDARQGLQLGGWDPAHRVRMADEVGGQRRYQGSVVDARICAPRSDEDEEVCISDGASFTDRRELVRAAQREQAVRLSGRVRSTSSRQSGPTRIITFSQGPGSRNATLGQSGDDLILRLRMPLSGPNGADFQFRLGDAVPVGEFVTVDGSYRDGTVRIEASSGGTVYRSRDFRLSRSWLYTWLVAGRVEPSWPWQPVRAIAAGVILVLFVPGLIGGLAAGRLDMPLIVAGGSGAAASVSVLMACNWGLALHPTPEGLLVAGTAGAAAAVLGNADARVLWRRDSGGRFRTGRDAV